MQTVMLKEMHIACHVKESLKLSNQYSDWNDPAI